MKRRSFFAALLAPLVAKFAHTGAMPAGYSLTFRKPQPKSGIAIAHAYREDGHTFYSMDWDAMMAEQRKYNAAMSASFRLILRTRLPSLIPMDHAESWWFKHEPEKQIQHLRQRRPVYQPRPERSASGIPNIKARSRASSAALEHHAQRFEGNLDELEG